MTQIREEEEAKMVEKLEAQYTGSVQKKILKPRLDYMIGFLIVNTLKKMEILSII